MATYHQLSFLLVLTLSIISASSEVNIDCGRSSAKSPYVDENSINWSGDDEYIQTGESHTVSSNHSLNDPVLDTMRVFENDEMNCYNMTISKNSRVLLRASFFYGNYDGKSFPPTFNLYYDGQYWTKVVTSSEYSYDYEVIYNMKNDDNTVSVCVTQNSSEGGYPLISAIQVRPLGKYMYSFEGMDVYPLFPSTGAFYGSNSTIRYPTDPYDRIWRGRHGRNGLIEVSGPTRTAPETNRNESNLPPTEVLRHAITGRTPHSTIIWPPDLLPVGFQVYIVFYFSELTLLQPNETRSFQIFLGAELVSPDPIIPPYNDFIEWTIKNYTVSSSTNITLVPTNDSTLPPLINALEVLLIGDPSENSGNNNNNGTNTIYDGSNGTASSSTVTVSNGTVPSGTVPNGTPPSVYRNSLSSYSLGAIFGTVVGVVGICLVVVGILCWWKGCCYKRRRKDTLEDELKGKELQTKSFTYRQIQVATDNFSPDNKIGEGGFGPVYKGTLSDGTAIAVKQLSATSRQGNREFVTEIGMISALQHPHLVTLHGCCIDGNNLLLIYEYMENNSLASVLFGTQENKLNLDWPTRHKICVGMAEGLAYLHDSRLKIVHRDIKTSNVLLDGNLTPKISDFGLARLHDEEASHISTRVAGTMGYMAPEYGLEGRLTEKADVYSFGVVLLEVVSGKINNNNKPGQEFNLLKQARLMNKNGNILELVDPRLESKYEKDEVLVVIEVALLCTSTESTERPSMSTVVSMIKGSTSVSDPVLNSSDSLNKMNFDKMTNMGQAGKLFDERDLSASMDAPQTGSSESTAVNSIRTNSEFF